jgi:hypothetical protein
MIIAELPFREFDSLLKIWAKKKHFELIVYLVARNADTPKLFEEIERNWSAIHDVTGSKMLFVLIDGQSNSFQNDRRQIEGSYGFYLYSPFCQMVSSLETELSYDGYFSKYIVPHQDHNKEKKWQQNHSVSMTEVARVLDLNEKEIPCLNFYLVSCQSNITFSLKNLSQEFSIYKVFKKISEGEDYFTDPTMVDESVNFLNSKKYKKYVKHQELLNKFKLEAQLDLKTKEWFNKVIGLEVSDKDVYENIRHLKDKHSMKEFSSIRAALNSLVYVSDDHSFIKMLKFEQKKQHQLKKTSEEFKLFIEQCFTYNYELD